MFYIAHYEFLFRLKLRLLYFCAAVCHLWNAHKKGFEEHLEDCTILLINY